MLDYKLPLVALCGKFQGFHNAHLKFLLGAFDMGEHVIIGITNPDPLAIRKEAADPARSSPQSNPFTYYERYLMISENLKDKKIDTGRYDIVPFPINVPELWFYYIPKEVIFLITLYDNDPWLEAKKNKLERGGYATDTIWRRSRKTITGTEVRARMRAGENWESLVPKATARIIKRLELDKKIMIRSNNKFPLAGLSGSGK